MKHWYMLYKKVETLNYTRQSQWTPKFSSLANS